MLARVIVSDDLDLLRLSPYPTPILHDWIM
jgi:hypothetical protein